MAQYTVKLIFKYSDVLHVEAESEREAIDKAMADCDETYECFYDTEITKE